MTIIAAADGSALGNPGPAGWAWYVNDDCWSAGGWPHGTNNQGELMAVLDLFRATAHRPEEDLRILCDSQYVINSITKWMPGWKRKGWRKADGKPVLNVDLLKDLDRELAGRKYTFEWVKGHAGHPLNEAADDRARAAATAYQQRVAPRIGPGYLDSTAPRSGAAEMSDDGASAGGRNSVAGRGTVTSASAGQAASGWRGAAEVNSNPSSSTSLPTHQPALYDEPDLFSELAAFEADAVSQHDADDSAEKLVTALERDLLSPQVRGDIGQTAVLLHPEFVEIGSSGRMWSRDAIMMALEEDPGERIEMEVLSTDRISDSSILLTYRSLARAGSSLRSSLWVLDGARWRLRFHQGTPEA
ncbi:Ribonuclease HI [Arthrobacter ulcerisalmonis]|uniref:Ribonuclease H n=1 Tax=Arthrobacter ulcerisalmonis TaxID=2483813 RepID=A0A3P5WQ13_9MICC|nr:ribonuclease HI family protein [Arthrobacter ulcerisalmonis]VDC23788.1 Ribonuclease HI [Arthrobacter ulcerisalmonis]